MTATMPGGSPAKRPTSAPPDACATHAAAPRSLVLFDIDGTLLTAGGAPRRALEDALTEVYGTAGPVTDHDFSGKTDPQIVAELMQRAGLRPESIDTRLREALRLYVSRLALHLADEPGAHLYPGVQELVAELSLQPHVALGLLTGNVADGARVKLERFGLWEHFPIGAFGSDHADRNRLPAIAVARAEARWGVRFPPRRTYVVGDTPLDIAAARVIGAVVVAVGTGSQAAALPLHAPDHLLADLTNWRETLWPVLTDGGSTA